MKVAALLWALEMYDQAARLIEDFQTRASKEAGGLQGMPKGLNLLRVAAFLRGGGGLHPQEKAVSEIRRDRGSLRGEQRGIYDLGLGYVLYFARRQENQGARTSLRNRGAVDRLAQECFALGQEAINLLSQAGNQLALVYAINHCAYIATMTNLDVDAYPYVKRLLDFKASPDLWHARFDDTIGVYYCHKADRYIAERDLTGAEKSVQFASDYLADAKENDTGGIEIEAHLSELEDVRDRLGRAQPRSRRRKSSSNGPRRSST
jgi:hypothetical protein